VYFIFLLLLKLLFCLFKLFNLYRSSFHYGASKLVAERDLVQSTKSIRSRFCGYFDQFKLYMRLKFIVICFCCYPLGSFSYIATQG
jgi:hypothetical protein